MADRFFVVRPGLRGLACSIEHGDFFARYSKHDRQTIIYRERVPDDWSGTLDEAIQLFAVFVQLKSEAVHASQA